MLQFKMSKNVAKAPKQQHFIHKLRLRTRHFSTFALRKVSDEIFEVCLP